MLSFLGSEESENPSARSSRSDNAAEKHSSGSGADNKQQSQEYLTVAVKGKKVYSTTRLFAVLFGAVLLCLWFMIRQNIPGTAAASSPSANYTERVQIEKAIARLMGTGSVMSTRLDSIMKKFYEFSSMQQIGVNELIKNPFRHEIFIGNRGNFLAADYNDPNGDSPIELLSIMKTEEGDYCCMINDKILYEGDSIRGFKVVQIGEGFVKLEGKPSGGQEQQQTEIVLKFSQ
jgi:hypothetical protein